MAIKKDMSGRELLKAMMESWVAEFEGCMKFHEGNPVLCLEKMAGIVKQMKEKTRGIRGN